MKQLLIVALLAGLFIVSHGVFSWYSKQAGLIFRQFLFLRLLRLQQNKKSATVPLDEFEIFDLAPYEYEGRHFDIFDGVT